MCALHFFEYTIQSFLGVLHFAASFNFVFEFLAVINAFNTVTYALLVGPNYMLVLSAIACTVWLKKYVKQYLNKPYFTY